MPRLLFARPPADETEQCKVLKLAGARHAPADWIHRAQIIELSWTRMRGQGSGAFRDRPGMSRF